MNLLKLLKNPDLKRYGGNTFWLLGERMTQTVLAFVVGIFIARTLGPDAFGLLNFAISFGLLFSVLIPLGTDQIVVDELVRNRQENNRILGSALSLRFCGLSVMAVLVAGSAFCFFPAGMTRALILIILTGYLGMAMNGIDGFFQARVAVGKTAPVVILTSILFAGLNLWGCYAGYGLYFFGFTNSGIVLCAALGKWLLYHHCYGAIPLRSASFETMRHLLKRSRWVFAQLLLASVTANVGYLILKAVCSDEEVGFYAVTAKMLLCTLIFPEVLALSLFPAIIEAADRKALFEQRLGRLYAVAFWGGMLAVGGAFLLGEPVIRLFYGVRYSESGRLLWIALLALPLNALFMVFSRWCIVREQQSLLFIQAVSGAVSAVFLNWFLSRGYGLSGAVWSLPVNAFLQYLVLFCCNRESRRQQCFIFKSVLFCREKHVD